MLNLIFYFKDNSMKLILILLMSMMLTACSKQPSESDIRLALQTELKENNEEVNQMQKYLTIKVDSEDKKETVKVSENNTNSESGSDDSLEIAFKDISKAMDSVGNLVDKTVDKAIAPVFEAQIYELVDVKKLGDCIQQENPAQYKCKVKATVKNNSGTVTNTTDLIFIRSEGGEWITLYEV